MVMQRVPQQLARRVFAPQSTALTKTLAPLAITPVQQRTVAFSPSSSPAKTTPTKPTDAYTILVAQRKQRPISPHLSIYKPQITWYGSALNRVTGSLLSGGFYVFGAAYLASPVLGWHLESANLAEWFGAFGTVTKFLAKFTIALPFTFHSFNGVRHLVWDTGRELSNVAVMRTGWVVVGLTLVSSGLLAYVGS